MRGEGYFHFCPWKMKSALKRPLELEKAWCGPVKCSWEKETESKRGRPTWRHREPEREWGRGHLKSLWILPKISWREEAWEEVKGQHKELPFVEKRKLQGRTLHRHSSGWWYQRESPSNICHSHITATTADRAPTCLSPNPLAPHQDRSEDINKELKKVLWKVRRWQSKKGKKNVSLPSALPRCMFLQRLYLD